ncbi:PfkB family carbohydrate kinase [Flavihumibacter rivuli]|uniref:carbohydrate kinase family protein n=1 Tax=Flavihumibacter rivuli TaxID=2838156 RepID=UPI001BDE773F|nr:PfkB family carbohydrate kinase [Flavihumibacter rivuli]ULQ56403.1 PfkB family carbohydrate kinase [Flavihumibacter rivuli]
MQPAYVLAIGEALIDAVSTQFVDDLSQARALDLKPGGSPANFCRFLNQLGTNSKLVAAVGKDGMGSIILRDMDEKGIDTSDIQLLEDHATTIILVGKSKGTPDFIAYRGADKEIHAIRHSLVEECSIIHTTAFALSKEPARHSIMHALQQAKATGKQVSIDFNYAEKIWGKNNDAEDIFTALLSMQPLLKCSMDDVERFTGKPLSEHEAREFLGSYNTTVTCLTCGSNGVWFKTMQDDWKHAPAEPVQVVDSTGAGDSFWAGFIHAWMQRQPVQECIKNALATAALRLQGKL